MPKKKSNPSLSLFSNHLRNIECSVYKQRGNGWSILQRGFTSGDEAQAFADEYTRSTGIPTKVECTQTLLIN
jgi:hypothetical protein